MQVWARIHQVREQHHEASRQEQVPILRSGTQKNMTFMASFRPKRCNSRKGGCGSQFSPTRSMQAACSIKCAQAMAERLRMKKEAAIADAVRKEDRRHLEALKTISQLEEECRKIVQKIARIRDRNDGCISCHMGPNYGGIWHGSHYRAHGGCSSLQFHLWNIHKACAQCNLFKGGNKEGFILGIIAKRGYGRERLEWLDSQPKSKRFERDYLLRFKDIMSRRMKRLERSALLR